VAASGHVHGENVLPVWFWLNQINFPELLNKYKRRDCLGAPDLRGLLVMAEGA
jgi:hypothetical protein